MEKAGVSASLGSSTEDDQITEALAQGVSQAVVAAGLHHVLQLDLSIGPSVVSEGLKSGVRGEVLANKRLLLHLPVFGQVKALNRLSTKDPQAMQVIRDLVLKMLVYNVQLVVVRAAHSVNPAIFVAQGDERAFATLMGYSDQQPTLILDYLCPEIYMDSWM